jgi:hypothetical protein
MKNLLAALALEELEMWEHRPLGILLPPPFEKRNSG